MNEELEQHQNILRTNPLRGETNENSCTHLHINWDFPTIVFCQWMNSDQAGNLMRAETDTDFGSMCTESPSFWRKSTYLTPTTSALCNLPSHSPLCRTIVWEMKDPFWSGRRCERSCLFCSVALVVRAHGGHRGSRELWLRCSLGAHSTGSVFPRVTRSQRELFGWWWVWLALQRTSVLWGGGITVVQFTRFISTRWGSSFYFSSQRRRQVVQMWFDEQTDVFTGYCETSTSTVCSHQTWSTFTGAPRPAPCLSAA